MVVVIDSVAEAAPLTPGDFNPNSKVISPNLAAEVVRAPNEDPVAAVQVGTLDFDVNSMVLKPVVMATVELESNLGGSLVFFL